MALFQKPQKRGPKLKPHKMINEVKHKHCPRCAQWLPLTNYGKHSHHWDKLRQWCRGCEAAYAGAWREANLEQAKATRKTYLEACINQVKAYSKARYMANRGKILASKKTWRENNLEEAKARERAWQKNNPEKARAWQQSEAGRRSQGKSCQKRRSTPMGKLNHCMSSGIQRSLKKGKGGKSWRKLVPYTSEELLAHLLITLPEGYAEDDFFDSDVLHIDHIVPLRSFVFDSPEDLAFQKAWAMSNLRLLSSEDNMRKGGRLGTGI